MNIKLFGFALLLLLQVIRCDDYLLTEDEQEELEKEAPKEDFMKNFACLVASQRFIFQNKNAVDKYSSKPNFNLRNKRLNAAVFRHCFETLTEEEKGKVAAAKSRSDFDQITFKGLARFDVQPALSAEEELTADEQSFLKMFNDVDKRIKEIQKNTMRENPDRQDEEDDDTWEEVKRTKGQKPKIGALDVDSPVAKYLVVAFLAALAGFIYLLYQRLTAENQIPNKKQKKKQGKQIKTD